jgi:hypothetical protein
MRVDSTRGWFIPKHRRAELGDCYTRFEAALIADEAKGIQIVGELDAGRLKWNKRFWGSRQLNFNPNKEHLLANVSDDRVLTTGQAASRGLLLRHYQALQAISRMSTGSSTFRGHHLSEYSTIMRAFPQPFVPSTTPIVAVHPNTPLGVAAAAAAAARQTAAAAPPAARQTAGAYRGGPMHEENDRAAICAIIGDSSEHLSKTQIANKAGTEASDHHFKKLFNKYTKKDGGWRCTAATVATQRKQYVLV